jgi:hypothetical protein
MSKEIAFKPDVATEAATRADFTYKITPNTITITDTTLGNGQRASFFALCETDEKKALALLPVN